MLRTKREINKSQQTKYKQTTTKSTKFPTKKSVVNVYISKCISTTVANYTRTVTASRSTCKGRTTPISMFCPYRANLGKSPWILFQLSPRRVAEWLHGDVNAQIARPQRSPALEHDRPTKRCGLSGSHGGATLRVVHNSGA